MPIAPQASGPAAPHTGTLQQGRGAMGPTSPAASVAATCLPHLYPASMQGGTRARGLNMTDEQK